MLFSTCVGVTLADEWGNPAHVGARLEARIVRRAVDFTSAVPTSKWETGVGMRVDVEFLKYWMHFIPTFARSRMSAPTRACARNATLVCFFCTLRYYYIFIRTSISTRYINTHSGPHFTQ